METQKSSEKNYKIALGFHLGKDLSPLQCITMDLILSFKELKYFWSHCPLCTLSSGCMHKGIMFFENT